MCEKCEKYKNMLFSVVDELELSDYMIDKCGPMGIEPAKLVRMVLDRKDLKIKMLKKKYKHI